MNAAEPEATGVIEWAVAGAPLAGEVQSGDLHVVAPFADGVLVALADGLGHGPEAAEAARAAAQVLTAHADEAPIALAQRCHEALRKTRGVALTLASFQVEEGSLTWLGVGNVEGLLVRGDARGASESVALRGGVVGYQMPPLRAQVVPVTRGDVLVLATDGIRVNFKAAVSVDEAPQAIAGAILERHARGSDDACVVVARYLGLASARVSVRDDSDLPIVRKRLRAVMRSAGFRDSAVEAMATAVTELARNMVMHAGGGEILVRRMEEGGRTAVTASATDRGPGIADVARALQDEYSTGGGLGLGLSSARRLADDFELTSTVGQGTTVTVKKWLA